MIKYLGSKRLLLPHILGVLDTLPGLRSAVDLFSGTSRVGRALKARGLRVTSVDHNAYAEVIARCYVQADHEEQARPAQRLLTELARLPGREGWFTETYCHQSRFFQPKNGARVDAIREEIARLALPPELEAVLLTALMEAADRVDSTTGVQMAVLKQWAPRAHKELELRLPELLPRARQGKGRALRGEAEALIDGLQADLIYLDPPYNQHKYLGNYHIWESLVRWDKPPVYGVARKREDCRERQSAFNQKAGIGPALAGVVERADARWLLVSFNDEGHLGREELLALLGRRGPVRTWELDHKRYVGAQIGIHNPRGEKVGQVGRLRNREWLFLVGPT